MTRISVIFVVLALIMPPPIAGYAQGTASYDPRISSAIVSSLPLLGSLPGLDLERFSLSSRAVFAWKHLGLNYSLDYGYRNFGVVQESPLEIVINNRDVLTARVDSALRVSRGLRLFGIAEGNFRSNVPVSTPVEPANADFGEPAVWQGSRLEWWTLDAGIAHDLGRDFRIIAGMRLDHLQMELRDPVNLSVPGDFAGDDYRASFRSKMWIPYMGMEIYGSGYSVALIATSLASVSFQVPFRYLRTAADDEEAFYSFSAGGYFLEGTLHYVMLGNASVTGGLWAKASLMRFKGAGREGLVNASGAPLPRTISGFSTYTRYEYSLGLAASVIF